ncbi:GNAT family N-acetyltransferase [Virgibacillus sp. DJP39]|uniref:GNAT family N-acetyltransferase n=1 Tax=Virgibacillus sp. DJP39 TaxID=3409790 RepID=UPI003BB5AB2A
MNIETERLFFRQYTDSDFEFLSSLLSDPEMVRFIGNGKTREKEETENFLEWIYSTYKKGKGMGLMVLVNKENGSPVGHAGLVPQTIDGISELEVGYWISRNHWGKGYATEAAKALIDYGINFLDKKRFIALIQPGNLASKKVAKKLDMSAEKQIVLGGQKVEIYSVSY